MTTTKDNLRDGFVLVMALWSLAFLTILALAIGLGTRQKIMMLGRLEDRSQCQFSAEAGAKKAIAVLLDDLEINKFLYSSQAKVRRHNNSVEFASIELGNKTTRVACEVFDELTNSVVDRPGLCDEHSKININIIETVPLTRLIVNVLGIAEENARLLAVSIIDWRDYGQREATGFFSDDYYKNLEFPYEMKSLPFERIDELLLVKGMTSAYYAQLKSFITISGDGLININTVSKPVLCALGMDVMLSDKILKARRGQDNQEATADDHIFTKTYDIASEINALIPLEEKELRFLDVINAANIFGTDSLQYSFLSKVFNSDGRLDRSIDVVFDASRNKIEYWFEK